MNRWIHSALLSASVLGALAVPGAAAYASDASHDAGGDHAHHGREGGLLGAALRLDSLTADQRASIDRLAQGQRAASVPVRAADAQFLTALAQQVERARVEPEALASALGTEQTAAAAQATAERDTLSQLHAILTAAQRNQLVDRLTQARSHHHDADAGPRAHDWLAHALDLTPGQQAEIRANLQAGGAGPGAPRAGRAALLQAFRGDSFDPSAFVVARSPGVHLEKLAEAAVPVLTPAQRASFADRLRKRAAHESRGA